jgi:NADH-quinone oxidoreductase subunit C
VEDLTSIKTRVESAISGVRLQILTNSSPSGQNSLLVDADHVREVAEFVKDAAGLRFDYASNVTGVDWPEKVVQEKVRSKQLIDGVEREIEQVTETRIPGYLEVVYHLYSMELKHGPLILRMRTGDRQKRVHLPSLTPVWRSAEFQEREVFDLFGVIFDQHPDLRRILMWDGFEDHPMRKDYVAPDDYEYEPTAHDEVLERAKKHQEGAT